MRPDDRRVLAVAAAFVGLLDALTAQRRAADDADALMPFPFGLEHRAARSLMREGRLATTKIGRRIFTRRSAVLALVGDTPQAAPRMVGADPAAAARAAYDAPLRVLQGRPARRT
jgi:hypothetical protein